MSTISKTESRNPLYFSMEKPTQSMGKKLLIEQNEDGIKLTVKENDRIYQVNRTFSEGLPTTSLIPREFFDASRVKIVNLGNERKVCFTQPILGGMDSGTTIAIRVENVPQDESEITSFYTNETVINKVDNLKKSGNFTLGEVVAYLQSGASATVGAYFYGKSFQDVGATVTRLHHNYFSLVSDTSIAFTQMQTNNIIVVKQHILGSQYASVGRLKEGLQALQLAPEYADKNIKICEDLLKKASEMNDIIESSKLAVNAADNKIRTLLVEQEQNRQSLESIRERIKTFEETELRYINEVTDSSERDKITRAVRAAFTCGIYLAVKGAGDSEETKRAKEQRDKYTDLKAEQQKIEADEIKKKQEILASLKKASGAFDSHGSATLALQIAEMALVEVTASIQNYRTFMVAIKEQTTLASKSLQNLVEFGESTMKAVLADNNSLVEQHKKIFIGNFRNSIYQWITLCVVGQTCRDALAACKDRVFAKLSLTTSDQSQQKEQADKELKELGIIFDQRAAVKQAQIQYTESLRDEDKYQETVANVIDVMDEPPMLDF